MPLFPIVFVSFTGGFLIPLTSPSPQKGSPFFRFTKVVISLHLAIIPYILDTANLVTKATSVQHWFKTRSHGSSRAIAWGTWHLFLAFLPAMLGVMREQISHVISNLTGISRYEALPYSDLCTDRPPDMNMVSSV